MYTSYDHSEFDGKFFDDDPMCNIDDDQSIMFAIDLYEFTKVDDNHFHHLRSKPDPENFF